VFVEWDKEPFMVEDEPGAESTNKEFGILPKNEADPADDGDSGDRG